LLLIVFVVLPIVFMILPIVFEALTIVAASKKLILGMGKASIVPSWFFSEPARLHHY
jgi:hypothetical protein